MSRRALLRGAIAGGATSLLGHASAAAGHATQAAEPEPLHERPAPADRRFSSPAVEAAIERVRKQIADAQLALIFANCPKTPKEKL
jgi:uncharacterized protein